MFEYPMKLVDFLKSKHIKVSQFDRMLGEFTDYSMRVDNSASESAKQFFQTYFDSPDPGCAEMFSLIRHALVNHERKPVFILPTALVADIRMQQTFDNIMSTPVEWQNVFSMPFMRKGQLDLLKGLFSSKAQNKIMAASTGIGKTLVFLAYAAGKPTIIVEPDRGLQIQLEKKYGCVTLMGRSNYHCRDFGGTADVSPCRFKDQSETSCSSGCPWYDAHHAAAVALEHGGAVVTNAWNMWQFFRNVKLVIFDEFHKILNELTVRYSIPNEVTEQTGLAYLQSTHDALNDEKDMLWEYLREDPEDMDRANRYNAVMNELQSLMLFMSNYEGAYIYDDGERRYLKLDKTETMKYIASHYSMEKVFVSATPVHIPNADLIVSDDAVSRLDNAPIVYYPIGKLTSAELKRNPDNLKTAADVINVLYEYFAERGKTKKVIIHTGNTTTHMAIADHLKMKCLKHTKGSLKETVEKFLGGTYDALLIAAADAGYDFYGADFGLQFILKVPYPSRTTEWASIAAKFGDQYEQTLYSQEAIDQIIQASGRICRGSDDLGMTVILDSKFADLFNHNREKFPDDFVNRLVDLTGDLKRAFSKEKIDYYQEEKK